jgi:hypothetical protein
MAEGTYTNEELNQMYASGVLTMEMLLTTI